MRTLYLIISLLALGIANNYHLFFSFLAMINLGIIINIYSLRASRLPCKGKLPKQRKHKNYKEWQKLKLNK